jgi:hypothetical protein
MIAQSCFTLSSACLSATFASIVGFCYFSSDVLTAETGSLGQYKSRYSVPLKSPSRHSQN